MPEPTTDAQPDLLTISEAAELLRAPVATLRYWRHLGTGPRSFRLGRRVLYRRDDLHSWIATQQDRTAQAEPRSLRATPDRGGC
jgi:excisionase family DNA binding protein